MGASRCAEPLPSTNELRIAAGLRRRDPDAVRALYAEYGPVGARAAARHDPRPRGRRGRLPAGAARSVAALPQLRPGARLAAHVARDDRALAGDRPPASARARAVGPGHGGRQPAPAATSRRSTIARPPDARRAAAAPAADGVRGRAAALPRRPEPEPDRAPHRAAARHGQVAQASALRHLRAMLEEEALAERSARGVSAARASRPQLRRLRRRRRSARRRRPSRRRSTTRRGSRAGGSGT